MLKNNRMQLFTVTTLALALSACNLDNHHQLHKPDMPKGLAYTNHIADPQLPAGDIAVVDGQIQTTNDKHNTVAFDPTQNPILQILSGFNKIWSSGDATWASNGSSNLTVTNGDTGVVGGATSSTAEAIVTDFSNATIKNPTVWKENFDYVTTLKQKGETTADVDRSTAIAQINAYLDDQRNKGYSIITGLGPLAADYRSGANATSDYKVKGNDANRATQDSDQVTVKGTVISITNSNHLMDNNLADGGNYGQHTAPNLDAVVTLLDTVAAYGASTEAPKYHFESPRPWRLDKTTYKVPTFDTSSASDLTKRTCYDLQGNSVVKYFEEPTNPVVTPLTGLLCAGKNVYVKSGTSYSNDGFNGSNSTAAYSGSGAWVSARGKDGAFPSGHTAEAYDRGLTYAYAIPERFAEMVARAGDLGEDRIVAGMHSPLDVIGGRIMALAVTAAMLNDSANNTAIDNALTQAHSYFATKATNAGFTGSDNVYQYAHSDPANDPYGNHAAFKKQYLKYMTYGFTPLNEPLKGTEVPKGAEALLKSRLPYLSDQQRRAVLATTEIASNYPVIDDSHGWGRLNLVAAADGYGAFNGNVNVYMDANNGGFNAVDHWRNDISGAGRLLKDGTGTLYLEGNNSYSGGTLLEGGTLVAGSVTAFGNNTLYQTDGTVKVQIAAGNQDSSKGALTVSDFVQDKGTLALDLTDYARIVANNGIYLNNGKLQLTIPVTTQTTTYTLLSARKIVGGFDASSITVSDVNNNSHYKATLAYSGNTVTVTIVNDFD
ncbi:phosphatase PAP2 family protein [Celerinatantimonas yamalensis]|uniref:Phosphatase PAP2 family protein n=1 Tax=Celerinatantimonas yamalensis TaxID=559956 RepID=A0ABW9G6T6_9GAMM